SKQDQDEKPTGSLPDNDLEEQPERPIVSRDVSEGGDDENLSPGALRKAKMKRLKLQKDIIDDFIDTTPQMPTPKRPLPQEETSRKDLSAESLKVETEIVSENMAIIYKNQGKPQKAVDIYNKLILKFPEKEAYFAARIKELNK
ncbi:MAG: tetratricopeptide repeat protein, partial [Cyclobacteriaceae bacterium]